jgi:hypothetical protein
VDEVYNKKILSAIVAILAITATLSTMTTVLATHTPEVSLAPTMVGKQARVLFTLVVKNASGDGIDNIKIWIPTDFIELIIGAENAENLKIAVDNLGVISDNLPIAGENLKSAGADLKAAGPKLVAVADYILNASSFLAATQSADASRLTSASLYIRRTGENLSVEPADISYASSQLKSAGTLLGALVYDNLSGNQSDNNIEENATDNLKIAGSAIENAAENVKAGDLYNAVAQLKIAENAIDNAGRLYKTVSLSEYPLAGDALISAASNLKDAWLKLESADNKIKAAGAVLQSLYPKWENVVSAIENVTLTTAGGWLDNVSENLKVAGDNLAGSPENIFQRVRP